MSNFFYMFIFFYQHQRIQHSTRMIHFTGFQLYRPILIIIIFFFFVSRSEYESIKSYSEKCHVINILTVVGNPIQEVILFLYNAIRK